MYILAYFLQTREFIFEKLDLTSRLFRDLQYRCVECKYCDAEIYDPNGKYKMGFGKKKLDPVCEDCQELAKETTKRLSQQSEDQKGLLLAMNKKNDQDGTPVQRKIRSDKGKKRGPNKKNKIITDILNDVINEKEADKENNSTAAKASEKSHENIKENDKENESNQTQQTYTFSQEALESPAPILPSTNPNILQTATSSSSSSSGNGANNGSIKDGTSETNVKKKQNLLHFIRGVKPPPAQKRSRTEDMESVSQLMQKGTNLQPLQSHISFASTSTGERGSVGSGFLTASEEVGGVVNTASLENGNTTSTNKQKTSGNNNPKRRRLSVWIPDKGVSDDL